MIVANWSLIFDLCSFREPVQAGRAVLLVRFLHAMQPAAGLSIGALLPHRSGSQLLLRCAEWAQIFGHSRNFENNCYQNSWMIWVSKKILKTSLYDIAYIEPFFTDFVCLVSDSPHDLRIGKWVKLLRGVAVCVMIFLRSLFPLKMYVPLCCCLKCLPS